MAIGDIYCIKMFQSYFTQECLNVFTYRQTGVALPGLSDAAGLFEAFDLDVLSDWIGMVSTSISIPEMEVFQIADSSDNHIATPTNDTGIRALADNLRAPSWVAAGFKSNRVGTGSRSSFKRFAGIGEIDINDNVLANSFITLAATVALKASMAAVIEAAGGSEYQPIQVKSGWVLDTPPVENFEITSWVDPKLTSQVSRKP